MKTSVIEVRDMLSVLSVVGVEKRIGEVPGVKSVTVNFAAGSAAVTAPTLFIVGSADHEVIELNQQAHTHLRCEKSLAIVPGATHLFEEAGALEQVAQLASSWFTAHLTSLQYTR